MCSICCVPVELRDSFVYPAFRITSEILLHTICNKWRSTLHAIACHSLQKWSWVSSSGWLRVRYIALMPFNITLTVCVYVHIDMIVLYLPAYLSVYAWRAPRCARCLRFRRWCRPSRTQYHTAYAASVAIVNRKHAAKLWIFSHRWASNDQYVSGAYWLSFVY